MKETPSILNTSIVNSIQHGDCLDIMRSMPMDCIDLVYMDPPYFTNRKHVSASKDRTDIFSFDDVWKSNKDYAEFIGNRLFEVKRILKESGSVVIHCDKSGNHLIRLVADEIFGQENFLSEIIWYYKRWSNSAKNLTPNHQMLLMYAKTSNYKFNKKYVGYSETTNVDQILQKRSRDMYGKSVYAKDANGNTVVADEKQGVPLGDVWEIPFLNPKAKERTGYPTQKPIALIDRIIEITTDIDDIVLDPFCGSGTTAVSAMLNSRKFIGIDISHDAISLSKSRLENPIRTNSNLMANGRESYINTDENAIKILEGLDIIPVQRNKGIDALLKRNYMGCPVPIRVQKKNESIFDAANMLHLAATKKEAKLSYLVATEEISSDDANLIKTYFQDAVKLLLTPRIYINQDFEDKITLLQEQ